LGLLSGLEQANDRNGRLALGSHRPEKGAQPGGNRQPGEKKLFANLAELRQIPGVDANKLQQRKERIRFYGGHEKSSKNCHLRTVGCILALSWRPKRKCRFMTVKPRKYSYYSSRRGIKCRLVNNSSRQRARVA